MSAAADAVRGAYDLEADAPNHARAVALATMRELRDPRGFYALTYRVERDRMAMTHVASSVGMERTQRLGAPPGPVARIFRHGPVAASWTDVIEERWVPRAFGPVGRLVYRAAFDTTEIFTLVARVTPETGMLLGFPLASPTRTPPRARARIRHVAAHLVSGLRLRGETERAEADAVLSPSGRLVHAESAEARATSAREQLTEAVVARERALAGGADDDAGRALDAWAALVDGRWSLVDVVESDGRRYVVARPNPPGLRDPRALSPRERDVASRLVHGHSNKYIAYELGLSVGRVGQIASSIARKLGARSRADAVRVLRAAWGTRWRG